MDSEEWALRERMWSLTRLISTSRLISTLQREGFFDPRGGSTGASGWEPRVQVVRTTLMHLLEYLAEAIGDQSRFDCYSDGMLGYSTAEAAAEAFRDCDELGPAAHESRREVLELLLRYWQLVCTVDSASPAMDLNKRIADAVSSVIDFDLTMAEHALRVAGDSHATVLDHLRYIETELRRRAGEPNTPLAPLVPLDVLRDWRTAIDAWVATGAPQDEVAPSVTDVIAAWAQALRVGGLERGWQGEEIVSIVNDIGQLTAVVVPTVIRRSGDVRVARLAIALARLMMALPPGSDVHDAIVQHLRASLVMVSERSLHARRAVERWADQEHIELPREIRQLLTPAVEMDIDDDGESSAIGLFDHEDVGDLAEAMRIQARLQRALTHIIDARVDRFLVEILVDDEESVSYVQGIWEDAETLHVEVAHGALVGTPTPPDRIHELRSLGWSDPDEDFPNHWQLIRIADRPAAAIAGLLVKSMKIAHDAFTDLPEDAVLSVSPPAAADLAFDDEDSIHAIDLDGDGEYIRVLPVGIRPSGLMPVEVAEDWLSAIDEALDSPPGRLPAPELTHAAFEALRAAAAAGLELHEAEGRTTEHPDHADYRSVLATIDRWDLPGA